ncbi:hypothetical protein LCGC14_1795420 [marine sediment metagenome]|uniref:Uncharacterized protein n=1 Tax=marine sediment metagenome TaxID=412755 RepID=A0A0F9GR71_9ZZZZ
MTRVDTHSVANKWIATLNASINNSVTSIVLAASGATGLATPLPSRININEEIMIVTAVAVDTPSGGLDTLTVTRGQDSTAASAHTAGDFVEQRAYASQITELQTKIKFLEILITKQMDNAEGVQRTSAANDLLVEAQASPVMSIKVQPGAGVVNGQPIALTTTINSGLITAPSVNPRIDVIQINQAGTISVKTGTEAGSPVAPAPDANNIKLAEIALTTGTITITTGIITDSRPFL